MEKLSTKIEKKVLQEIKIEGSERCPSPNQQSWEKGLVCWALGFQADKADVRSDK